MEMLVVMFILSILAAATLPYAEITTRRNKELELRHALRQVRTAIDRVHRDWEEGDIGPLGKDVSEDGYPKSLRVLVGGVETGDVIGTRRKYLRRVPRDPFADPAVPRGEQWGLRSYRDASDSVAWGGEDVYDIWSKSTKFGIDGTPLRDW